MKNLNDERVAELKALGAELVESQGMVIVTVTTTETHIDHLIKIAMVVADLADWEWLTSRTVVDDRTVHTMFMGMPS